jgi:hypothetical protein
VTEREEMKAAGGLGNPLGSPAAYFRDDRHDTLYQGDIILAPTVVAWSAASRPAPDEAGVVAPATGHRFLTPWQSIEELEAPTDLLAPPPVTLEVAYRPAMVLSHECEIEKEFNEFVAGHEPLGEAEVQRAITQATSRWDLDRYVLVTPLLDYHVSEVAEEKWPAIRSAQKIGYFPVLPLPNAPPPVPTFVHLSRVTTVERRLLAFARTLASLTPAAVHLLRIKLAETLSVRNLSVVSKLEAAIGHGIVDVKTLKQGRSGITVALRLDNETDLTVDVKADPKTIRPERTRDPRG